MLYKNTFKIFFSNGSLIWHTLLYLLISASIVFGAGTLILSPLYHTLSEVGWTTAISDSYMNFLNQINLKQLLIDIGDNGRWFVQIIIDNMGKLLPYIILFVIVIIVVGSIVVRFYTMSASTCVNYYMNSNVKASFPNNIFTSFYRNFRYQLAYTVTVLPINIAIYSLIIYMLKLFESEGFLFIITPFILVLTFTILASLKMTLFGGWLPAIVSSNKGVFACMKKGFVVAKRRFGETFGNAFALYLTIIFVNFFGGVLTFGVGLIVTIPASCILVCVFQNVSYYMAIGQKYYVDNFNVIAPKAQEYTDKFGNHKYII